MSGVHWCYALLLLASLVVVRAEECDKETERIKKTGGEVVDYAVEKVCKKPCVVKVTMFDPKVHDLIKKKVWKHAKEYFKGDTPVSDEEFIKLYDDIKKKCVDPIKDDICKDSKKHEKSIKMCVLGAIMQHPEVDPNKCLEWYKKNCKKAADFCEKHAPSWKKDVDIFRKNQCS